MRGGGVAGGRRCPQWQASCLLVLRQAGSRGRSVRSLNSSACCCDPAPLHSCYVYCQVAGKRVAQVSCCHHRINAIQVHNRASVFNKEYAALHESAR